jgi:D-arabinose 1-dehydrogenase-like Zn-dependent alcohol dehydrogenase
VAVELTRPQIDCVEDYPVPAVNPNDVLIKLYATGLCMSDQWVSDEPASPSLLTCT